MIKFFKVGMTNNNSITVDIFSKFIAYYKFTVAILFEIRNCLIGCTKLAISVAMKST